MRKDKKIVFSGMQATGEPHIGNYLGAIRHWVSMQQEDNACLYCIVDLHSLTVRQNPEELRANARKLLALYIALGIDPVKHIIYYQSHVSGHAELAWILNCFTYVGELNRMTQYKDKAQKNADNINAGLYAYPVLMAADVLLYGTDVVPVGDDQKQHMEICRDVAVRFNQVYGEIFTVPEPYISRIGARIMGLQDPVKKMSKSESENANNLVFLLDEKTTILNKFKRAVTDSGGDVSFDPANKPGVSNLLTIYACTVNKAIGECEKDFYGMGYGAFKAGVGEAVADMLKPFRENYAKLSADGAYLDGIIKSNALRAGELAATTLNKVKEAVGLPR